MTVGTRRDPFDGWSFSKDPTTGARHVRTPTGFERVYTEGFAATTLVKLVTSCATTDDEGAHHQLALWRRVVGEDDYERALAVIGAVAESHGGQIPDDADYFERRMPESA